MLKMNQVGLTEEFITKNQIMKAFNELNISEEELLLVYGDLSQNSNVIGGAQTVIEGLYEVLEMNATIVMPAHSLKQNCPTFFDETLPKEILSVVKENTPAFDKELTAISSGELATTFAMNNRVIRSNHPVASFLALGQKASWMMSNHQLDSMFGDYSPMQKLYAQDAKVLCLDMDYEMITAFHYIEYLVNRNEKISHEAMINENGERVHVQFEDLALNSSKFNEIGKQYEESREILKIMVGSMEYKVLDFKDFIDFGVNYLSK